MKIYLINKKKYKYFFEGKNTNTWKGRKTNVVIKLNEEILKIISRKQMWL